MNDAALQGPGLPAQPNQSVIAGVTILQAVIAEGAPVGSRYIARLLDCEHSKVNRILGTLVHMGMLRRTGDRKYVSGPGVHVLSAQSLRASGLVQASLAPLARFQALGATVALGTVWRETVCYLLHGGPDVELAATAGAHRAFPAGESVIGLLYRRRARVYRWNRAATSEVSWAAAIGEPMVAAIAAVFPADAVPDIPEARFRGLLRDAAREISGHIDV